MHLTRCKSNKTQDQPSCAASGTAASQMPLLTRILGVDLSLGGAPVAADVSRVSSTGGAAGVAVYAGRGKAALASPPGFRINEITRVVGRGRAAWSRAVEGVETGKVLDSAWVRFWRGGRGSRWGLGDSVVVGGRVLPGIWFVNVNRVVGVQRGRRKVSVAWGTTARHVLRGEEVVSVVREKNGDVRFSLRSFSRPHAFLAWLGYPLVVHLQHKFAHDVARQLERRCASEPQDH